MKSLRRRQYYLIFLLAQPLLILLPIFISFEITHTRDNVMTEEVIAAAVAQYLLLSFVLPLKKYREIISIILGFIISFINIYISRSLVFEMLGERTFSLTTYSLQYAGWVEWLSKHLPWHPPGDAILMCSYLLSLYLFSIADTEIVYKMILKNNTEKKAE